MLKLEVLRKDKPILLLLKKNDILSKIGNRNVE
jgi:hypothetical protein